MSFGKTCRSGRRHQWPAAALSFRMALGVTAGVTCRAGGAWHQARRRVRSARSEGGPGSLRAKMAAGARREATVLRVAAAVVIMVAMMAVLRRAV